MSGISLTSPARRLIGMYDASCSPKRQKQQREQNAACHRSSTNAESILKGSGWSRWTRELGWGWGGDDQVMLASQKDEFEKSKKSKLGNWVFAGVKPRWACGLATRDFIVLVSVSVEFGSVGKSNNGWQMRFSQIASGYATIPSGYGNST
ncbi:hypothetical protein T492DRAFT_831638 [Pavlovales sp. CCMP2436]|nr:hypothetical protein T492DRAFT_831638 [Pavlovales sp. CCMP2436]